MVFVSVFVFFGFNATFNKKTNHLSLQAGHQSIECRKSSLIIETFIWWFGSEICSWFTCLDMNFACLIIIAHYRWLNLFLVGGRFASLGECHIKLGIHQIIHTERTCVGLYILKSWIFHRPIRHSAHRQSNVYVYISWVHSSIFNARSIFHIFLFICVDFIVLKIRLSLFSFAINKNE